MKDKVIEVMNRKSDLPAFDEHLRLESYAQRSADIVNDIVRLTGFPPSPNMQYIREIVFCIPEDATMIDLQGLAHQIRQHYTIDCFQISIDREKKECHMLFDWYDRKNERAYHLYKSREISLSVLILRILRIPMVTLSDVWVVHYMMQVFKENPGVIERCLELSLRNRIEYGKLYGTKNEDAVYKFIELALLHARHECQSDRRRMKKTY